MMRYAMCKTGSIGAGRLSLMGALLAATLTSGCMTTTAGGDAGCQGYGEARLSMPRPLDPSPLSSWVADLDDRMTGICR